MRSSFSFSICIPCYKFPSKNHCSRNPLPFDRLFSLSLTLDICNISPEMSSLTSVLVTSAMSSLEDCGTFQGSFCNRSWVSLICRHSVMSTLPTWLCFMTQDVVPFGECSVSRRRQHIRPSSINSSAGVCGCTG